jgi:hypothetical protein
MTPLRHITDTRAALSGPVSAVPFRSGLAT